MSLQWSRIRWVIDGGTDFAGRSDFRRRYKPVHAQRQFGFFFLKLQRAPGPRGHCTSKHAPQRSESHWTISTKAKAERHPVHSPQKDMGATDRTAGGLHLVRERTSRLPELSMAQGSRSVIASAPVAGGTAFLAGRGIGAGEEGLEDESGPKTAPPLPDELEAVSRAFGGGDRVIILQESGADGKPCYPWTAPSRFSVWLTELARSA